MLTAFGQYTVKITEKNRLVIPQLVREKFEIDNYAYLSAQETHLELYLPGQLELLKKEVSKVSLLHTDSQNLNRLLFSGISETKIDQQGRIILNSEQLAVLRGKVGSEIVFIGANTRFEIWSKLAWGIKAGGYHKQLTESAERVAFLIDNLLRTK